MENNLKNLYPYYDPEIAIKILGLTEELCEDERAAALHLAVCLMGFAPDLEAAHKLCTDVSVVFNRIKEEDSEDKE